MSCETSEYGNSFACSLIRPLNLEGFSSGVSNAKGRAVSISSSVSTYSFSGYDALGRVTGGTQTLGSQTYSMSYTYDLAGHVLSETYPSGRTVTNNFDSAGRLSSVTGTLGDGASRSYSSGIIYSALGGMTNEQFGTDTPIYNKLQYNVRGQLWDVRVSTGADVNGTWNRGALQFFYSQPYSFTGGSGADNNGNVLAAKHYRPLDEGSSTYTISTDQYSYDPLNRITSVSENYESNTQGATQQFQQVYTYDRYGNRTINQAGTWGAGINNKQFTPSQTNNRLGVPSGQTGTMAYDNAGNLTNDTYSGQGQRNYDAENRMTQAWSNSQWQTYTYDASGQRVKRSININGTQTETWQVYGVNGELLAEYAANASASSPQKEYGYRNGQLLVEIMAAGGSGWGSPPSFTDNPLAAGVVVKALHITQLRTAINDLRGHLNKAAYPWQYSATTNDWISANPILEMRTALDDALGVPTPAYSAGLAQGQPIKAIHIQELRDRVLAAWGSGSGGVDIRWLVADQLGTPRIILDKTGALANVKRHDYLPFGEELVAGQGGRTTQQGYVADGIRQQFTSQERDNETGLDYMHARYFASVQGRFSSADSFGGSIGNPQSLNRYTYVVNNPINLSDPTGHEGRYNAHGVTYWMHQHESSLMLGGQREIDAAMADYVGGSGNWAGSEAETSKGDEDGGTEGKVAADSDPQNPASNSDGHEFAHSRVPCPPTGQQLAKNPVVKKGLQQAFDLIQSGRIERGGWIYWNQRSGKVFTILKDPKIDPLNPKNSDTLWQIDLNNPPTAQKGWAIVGDFHSHLDAGPDDWDIANETARKVPGIVISPAGPQPYGPKRGIWYKDLPAGCR